ncbi:MAG: insulinase family protein [Gemmatimonadales bacterium]|nr:MAG: insulinase family protein [Gemmatimonadales bacterium]
MALAAVTVAAPASPVHAQEVHLDVREFTLDNGMHFLVVPRPGVPTVSFVTHIPVGSVNEALGHTGIVHFLEHLLFKGTTTVGTRDAEAEVELFARMDAAHDTLILARGRLPSPDSAEIGRLQDRIRALEDSARTLVIPGEFDRIYSRAGARSMNATTSYEATEYFVELPANRAELWFAMEADRMRNPVFREFYAEREVITEERRQVLDTSPGGALWEAHMGAAFRVHPYGVAPIGHMADIEILSRSQVEEYYRRHYGPDNTTAVLVGDIDPDSARVWAEAYFGPMEPRGPPPPVLAREPEQRGERRVEVQWDAEPRLVMGWKIPSAHHADAAALAMLSSLLVAGRDSRLYRRLVRDEGMATAVTAGATPGGRFPGLFTIQATPRAPHTPEEVEAAIDQELQRLRESPPTEVEMERLRRRLEASNVRRLTSDLGLALQLASSQGFWGDWRTTFQSQARLSQVTADDVIRVLDSYFHSRTRTVGVLRREGDAAAAGVDGLTPADSVAAPTAALPAPTSPAGPTDQPGPTSPAGPTPGDTLGAAPGPELPELPAATPVAPPTPQPEPRPIGRDTAESLPFPELVLDAPQASEHHVAGVPVYHLHDPTLPLVDVYIQMRGGVNHYPRQDLAPLLGFSSFLRNGGTLDLPPDSVDLRLDMAAVQLGFGSGGGGRYVSMNVLTSAVDEGLALVGDILTEPGFDAEAVEVWRRQELDRLRRRADNPTSLAFEEFNRLVFGDHPVGWQLEEGDLDPENFRPDRLRAMAERLLCRDRLVVGIAGDLTWDEAEPRIRSFLERWPQCDEPIPDAPIPDMRQGPAVVILPRPLEQTTIVMAQPGGIVQEDSPDYFASRVADLILGGGGFSSRLMTRVRSEEGMTYGASSLWTTPVRHEGLVGAVTATRPERTVEAVELILEILDEMRTHGPSAEEVDTALDQILNGYVFAFQSTRQVVSRRMGDLVQGLPEDWMERYLQGIGAVTPEDVLRVAGAHIDPTAMTILLVGDPDRFGPGMARLGELGPVYRLSTDGSLSPFPLESLP